MLLAVLAVLLLAALPIALGGADARGALAPLHGAAAPSTRAGPAVSNSFATAGPVGAPAPARPIPSAPSPMPHLPGASNGTPPDVCFGVWPARGGQSLYPDECYGHDEPGFSAFSNLPGSGGNVSWSFTLPTDKDATHNQSDLYATFWFGMVLSDPHSALGEAFLELQFYPDHIWTSPNTVPGQWIAEVRVIQADLQSGQLDNAYISALEVGGVAGQYMTMHQGDAIDVNLTGWIGNPLGESVVVTDRTQGLQGNHRLYNATGGYPLNPSYSTNDFPDSLEWTTTGAPAVSFSFETGHAFNPSYPENNSFGGCSPGAPPSTARNPAVPCPSYDPASWVNDTGQPLRVSAPVFSNGTSRARAAEIDILNAGGGPAAVDPVSNGTCAGRDGSAYCSYPWFSYSCQYQAFEFGATNYPETSTDFGKYDQYSTVPVLSSEQFQYYPPMRYALPACGAPTLQVDVGVAGPSSGSIHLLRANLSASGTIAGLLPGNYSIEATPVPGGAFVFWNASGGVRVADRLSPWTSIEVLGNGSLSATFAFAAASAILTFTASGCTGRLSLLPGVLFNASVLPRTTSGGFLLLAPGIYTAQAMADPGCVFLHWSWNPSQVRLADSQAVFTWLVVSGSAASISLTAVFAPTIAPTAVWLFFTGTPGTVIFNGVPYTSDVRVNVSAGTYPVSIVPAAGNPPATFWNGIAVNSLDLRTSGNVTLSPGTMHSMHFAFNQSLGIRLNGSSAGGRFWLGGVGGPLPDGSTFSLQQPQPTAYPVLAFPPAGEAFAGWSALPTAALWPNPGGAADAVLANGSGNLTARFVAASPVPLEVDIFLSHGGSVRVDDGPFLSNDTTILNVAPGTHLIEAVSASGYTFAGWGALGTATLLPGGSGAWPTGSDRVRVTAGSPILNAFFSPPTFPITFVSSPLGASASIGGTPVPHGVTLSLPSGTYALRGTLASGGTIGGWTTTPGLALIGPPGARSVVVAGPGTVYASGSGPLDAYLTASPSNGIAPVTVQFTAVPLNGTPAYAYAWNFGDGGTGIGATPSHLYSTGGSFTVGLWINDSGAASAHLLLPLSVGIAPLVVQISANATSGVAPTWVSFNGSATGGVSPYQYLWDFGDGVGAASGPSANYEFLSPSLFIVTLSVRDLAGTISNSTQSIAVSAAPLHLTLSTPSSNVTVGNTLRVDAAVTGGAGVYTLAWSGLPAGCVAPPSYELACTVTTVGTYTISVLATDVSGSNGSASLVVHVLPIGGGSGTTTIGWNDPLSLAVLGGAGAAVLALAALFLWRRRARATPPTER